MLSCFPSVVASRDGPTLRGLAMSFHSRDARAVVEWAKAEITPLVVLLAAAVLALGFGLLADEVFEGSTAAFDRELLLAFRTPGNVADAIGPPWLEEAARDLTALGSY